jgi:acetolactate synthase-1/2/3 large subunit
MNNGSFGWIKMLQKLYCDERYFGVDFAADVDYAKVAEGFGLRGLRVGHPDEVGEAFRAALRDGRPTFIDVPTQGELEETPPVEAWQRALAGGRGR